MDPAVMAAAIGVGGTVIVAAVGFWSTKRASDKAAQAATVRALDAARDDRLGQASAGVRAGHRRIVVPAAAAPERVEPAT